MKSYTGPKTKSEVAEAALGAELNRKVSNNINDNLTFANIDLMSDTTEAAEASSTPYVTSVTTKSKELEQRRLRYVILFTKTP